MLCMLLTASESLDHPSPNARKTIFSIIMVLKIDPCAVCGTRVMSNSVLCRACGKWVHVRCTEKKKVSVHVNKNFVCKKCRSVVNNFKGSADGKLCDGVETVSKFTYLGDRLNATDGCETAVTARSRIGWMKFRECSEILKGRRFSLKMKDLQKLYKISYVVWK